MSCNMIMQGDQYNIGIKLKSHGEPIDIDTIDTIQFDIEDNIKYYKSDGSGDVIYNDETHQFLYPITEDESFDFSSTLDCQIRVKFTNNVIVGKKIGGINLQYSNTKESIDGPNND